MRAWKRGFGTYPANSRLVSRVFSLIKTFSTLSVFLFCQQALPSSRSSGANSQRNGQGQWSYNPKKHACYDSSLRSAPWPWAVAGARGVQTWQVVLMCVSQEWICIKSVTTQWGVSRLEALSREFPVLFWKVTLLWFQVSCPSLCVAGLMSPLIPDCFNLFPVTLMCLIVHVSLCPVPEYFVQSGTTVYRHSPCLDPCQVLSRLHFWFLVFS